MVGPNCMGLLNANPAIRLNASFSPIFPAPGHVGAVVPERRARLAILRSPPARRRPLDVRQRRQQGRRLGQRSARVLGERPATSVILLYLESFGNPRRFARLARRIGRSKPIVAVKAGRTRAGRAPPAATPRRSRPTTSAVDALFHQAGVNPRRHHRRDVRHRGVPRGAAAAAGRRVAIVTNAGGPGILAVDACEAAGLSVVPFSEPTRQRLAEFLSLDVPGQTFPRFRGRPERGD